ncbi:hypothetical protein ACFSCX_05940 [Bacillus salitolerans]|uniref:Uncharacterized protein n=1 Tax=Bacillus salitolerans TaxID=1437434 RepID=A0ABW4LLW5_9BACI
MNRRGKILCALIIIIGLFIQIANIQLNNVNASASDWEYIDDYAPNVKFALDTNEYWYRFRITDDTHVYDVKTTNIYDDLGNTHRSIYNIGSYENTSSNRDKWMMIDENLPSTNYWSVHQTISIQRLKKSNTWETVGTYNPDVNFPINTDQYWYRYRVTWSSGEPVYTQFREESGGPWGPVVGMIYQVSGRENPDYDREKWMMFDEVLPSGNYFVKNTQVTVQRLKKNRFPTLNLTTSNNQILSEVNGRNALQLQGTFLDSDAGDQINIRYSLDGLPTHQNKVLP